MENEQLAELIQQGGNDELLPLLWDKMRVLIYKKCGEIWRSYSAKLELFGYSLDDLRQEGYNALIFAVKGYKKVYHLLELCLKTRYTLSFERRCGCSQPNGNNEP